MNKMSEIEITVSPRSSKRTITIDGAGNIKAHLNSPPVEGKANAECISLFAKELGIAKSRISIEKGLKGRKKKLRIEGLAFDEVITAIRGKQ